MKTDNIFKFVSLRAPVTQDRIIRLSGNESAKKSIGGLLSTTDPSMKPEARRTSVGAAVVSGDSYFLKSEIGRVMARKAAALRALLQVQRTRPDKPSFVAGIEKLLDGVTVSLTDFLQSGEYSKVDESLWRSYYGLILAPTVRPQDREIIVDWLRAFYLLGSEDDATFARRASEIHKVRPALPFDWFAIQEQPKTKPEQPKGEGQSPTKGLQEGLQCLLSASSPE